MREAVTMGRASVERYRPGADEVCISIRSRGDTVASLRPGFRDVLWLEFDDDPFDDWQQRDRTITEDDAERVVRFVAKHADARRIVVHCFVGASRSVSLALALKHACVVDSATFMNSEGGAFWVPRVPNRGVYVRVTRALRRAFAPVSGEAPNGE